MWSPTKHRVMATVRTLHYGDNTITENYSLCVYSSTPTGILPCEQWDTFLKRNTYWFVKFCRGKCMWEPTDSLVDVIILKEYHISQSLSFPLYGMPRTICDNILNNIPCDLEILRMTLKNNRASLLCYFKFCVSFCSHWWIQIGATVPKRPIWVKFDDFRAVRPWNLTDDLEKQQGTSSMLLQALCSISYPLVNSNWDYSPETPNLGQIRWFLEPCELEIWRMTFKNNRAPILCYFKLCAAFHSHWGIQTGVTVRKRPIWVKFDDFLAPLLSNIKLCVSFHHHMWIQTEVTVRKRLSLVVTLTFDLWPRSFARTLPWSLVITPENFMMIRWGEHSKKVWQTDRRTENIIHRAAWSQLNITTDIRWHCIVAH